VRTRGARRCVAQELANAQTLLHPAEQQLDAPAALVEHGDRLRGTLEIINQKSERLAVLVRSDGPSS
jgi:hypothetical protein